MLIPTVISTRHGMHHSPIDDFFHIHTTYLSVDPLNPLISSLIISFNDEEKTFKTVKPKLFIINM